jgi:hypothetical protein
VTGGDGDSVGICYSGTDAATISQHAVTQVSVRSFV